MTDQRFTELLSEKLSGEISAHDDQHFMAILAENEDYRREYESLIIYFKQQDRPYENMDFIFRQIKERINVVGTEPKPIFNSKPVVRTFGQWYRIAAIFIFGLCTFFAYQFFKSNSLSDKTTAIAWKKTYTPGRQTSTLVLADGSKVTLNAASEIKYPASFKGGTREVYLSGEAFFDVAKDHQHPFIVHTKNISIKVLGTAFDVKSYDDEQATETTLLRGKVEITLNKRPAKHILLNPAEKFTLIHAADSSAEHLNGDIYSIRPMTYYKDDKNAILETSWMNNKLLFKNENFSLLSLRLARWYDVSFVFESDKLKDASFTGEFEKETLSEALKALQVITPFQYKIQGKTIYLYAVK
ncbi:ferric-dicitrate binding protein FerR (iron transport regulator) [Pedobacter cryoconitis]|uniref:Ferric-dicitrate binding protein FerR (Iron transport regulator) n=1 Tax=Pedobacter cryoconitis TaxID=188932 RepID=A0A7W8ZKU1_9SPHI|nr:FecR family protein [Pedobacter cryoconitis]MBB5635884.1 ferric-dicitrate binding protein FerR (iron transport regulator) [Pedobacter cryoconitis]